MPPSVLPAVATSTAGQKSSGLSLMRPNSAGSDPSGSSVAETKDTTKSVDKPKRGSASSVSAESSHSCMRADVTAVKCRKPVGTYAVTDRRQDQGARLQS